ncbi:MAG: hypothetical protein ABIO67_02350 [Mycobacteriales bacterium]
MKHLVPHDVSDLLLAPLALRLDQELEGLDGLTAKELQLRVSLETNRDPDTAEQRRQLLLEVLERFWQTHEWTLSWGDRGLVLTHHDHRLVLGIPANVRAFLADEIAAP